MRLSLVHLGLLVAAIPVASLGIGIDAQSPSDKPTLSKARVSRLEKQIADLQPRIAVQQRILADAQAELKAGVRPLAMTPAEAVASFEKDPKQPVTVEFGVAPIGFPDGPSRDSDDAGSPMVLAWDNLFPGGGTFSAVVPRPRVPASRRFRAGAIQCITRRSNCRGTCCRAFDRSSPPAHHRASRSQRRPHHRPGRAAW